MSDSRTREVERRALAGDRVAMAELLVLERRTGNPDAPRAVRCLDRGRCRWTLAQVGLLDALGGSTTLFVCVDCYASDVHVDLRRGAWLVGHPFVVAVHESGPRHAVEARTPPKTLRNGGTRRGSWRTCCGQRIDMEPAPRTLARATADAAAGIPQALLSFARDDRNTRDVLERLHAERDNAREGRRCCLSCARSSVLSVACRDGVDHHAWVADQARAWEPTGMIDEDRDELGPPHDPERWAWIMRRDEERRAARTRAPVGVPAGTPACRHGVYRSVFPCVVCDEEPSGA